MIIKLTDDRRKVLGVSLGAIYIANSDGEHLYGSDFGAVLNVAQDLVARNKWPDVEAMHVGLIDGPGNELSAYAAAVLALDALLHRHNVLVCCHTGSRSLLVAVAYLAATSGRTWDQMLDALSERVDEQLPAIRDVHLSIEPQLCLKGLL